MGEDQLGGRYRLGDLLGAGGTGSVREAHDTVLGRAVAVKRLRPGQDEQVRARLRSEARLAGALHHPGIAEVYDYGEEPDGEGGVRPYMVMQHVEGASLRQLLRERRTLRPGEVIRLVGQIAAALEVAHRAGIVHRDLKPGNVLITPDGRAVLVDFGIARTLDAEPLTSTGTIVGTADYISPEQSAGESATPRSDLYALGMVAYECLTGHKPFRRESAVATALAHLRDEAPPLGAEVPGGLRALVVSLTAKRPEDRPRDAGTVARMAAELDADPWTPPPGAGAGDSRLRRLGRALAWAVPRRSRLSGLTAAAALVLLVATVAMVLRPEVVNTPEAVAENTDARTRPAAPSAVVPVDDLLGASYARAARRLRGLDLVPVRDRVVAQGRPGSVVGVDGPRRRAEGSVVRLLVASAAP
ncbi:serine/threonine-protein kinase [Nocardioides pantholopis]|uniref:serine/threonine-protein kinase n=1 Tax=Nocardioides pantholopis TaxID=2483798 RepID=UPI000F08E5BD|nr:serine/threonine-protein kinase [Nocardioides pantholopis]